LGQPVPRALALQGPWPRPAERGARPAAESWVRARCSCASLGLGLPSPRLAGPLAALDECPRARQRLRLRLW